MQYKCKVLPSCLYTFSPCKFAMQLLRVYSHVICIAGTYTDPASSVLININYKILSVSRCFTVHLHRVSSRVNEGFIISDILVLSGCIF